MVELTNEQKAILKRYIVDFKVWLNSNKGQEDVKEHRKHSQFFKEKLSVQNIDSLNEKSLSEVYKKLWASNIWGNKEWYIQNKLIAPNGVNKIRVELKKLLYGPGDISVKFDEFRSNIKGFGPSILSEILHMLFPDKYCLWNNKPKTVLPILKLDNLLPERFFKYNLASGGDFAECISSLDKIRNELEENGINNPDFIHLDLFFWYVFTKLKKEGGFKEVRVEVKKKEVEEKNHVQILTHTGAEYFLIELGNKLGYDTYVTATDQNKEYKNQKIGDVSALKEIHSFVAERDLPSARNIDVIWFDENEMADYCFEVEHTTGVTVGLHRLYQLMNYNIKKFVVVAPEEVRSKFDIEINKSPYRSIKERFKFISYPELIKLLKLANNFVDFRTKLFGN